MRFRGAVAAFIEDTTRLIDLEGAFRSGKTTAALWKVFRSTQEHPGIHWLICRYSDGDTQSKLKPPWRAILQAANARVHWDPQELCDVFDNGSRVYIFGLKAPDQTSRYGKLRGLTLAGIYNDQSEELPQDVFHEMMGRLSQGGFPHQLILTPNPPDENHWLCREFPEDNHLKSRRYYAVSIHANAQNLPVETIEGLVAAYPPSHPKHRSAVLGLRGLNVIGQPVYGGDPDRGLAPTFARAVHVRALTLSPTLPLVTSLDFGKHHPCALFVQYTPWNQCLCLGGLMGQHLYLEDFAPIIQRYRSEWFPDRAMDLECCDPAGAHENSQGVRPNAIRVLRELGLSPTYKDHSNAPDVRLAMIERLAGYMRRRTPQGEAFGIEVHPARWLIVSPDQVKSWPFLADGCEAGYVWDEHLVSVGSKPVRRPKKDGWYEHGQNCLEYAELNFGGVQPTVDQVERQRRRHEQQRLRAAQRDVDPYDRVAARARTSRAGYP